MRAMREQADASGSGEPGRNRGLFGSVTLMTPNTLNLTTFDSATVVRPV
jgi:hypothetical protein